MKEMIFSYMLLNLQLFVNADYTNVTTDNGGTGTGTGPNNLSPEMKTYYDMALLDEAQPNLVHDQFGQKRPIPAGKGKTIEFRKYSNLVGVGSNDELTEGVTPNGDVLDVTSITATVKQYGNYVKISDVLDLTAIDNNLLEATKLCGQQAGKRLDTVTRDYLVAGTNVSYCPKINASTGAETAVTARNGFDTTARLTVKVIQQTVAKLRAQDAPTINGKYVAIIHPYVAYDLMRDSEWVDAHKYAQPTELYEGEIGEIAGVRFVQTTRAKIWRDSTCPAQVGATPAYYAVFATLFFGANAYGVTEINGGGLRTIVKQLGSAGTADPLDQRATVGWKAIKVAEILNQNYMVRVESCSPVYSATATAN